jgi:hypothetical protein
VAQQRVQRPLLQPRGDEVIESRDHQGKSQILGGEMSFVRSSPESLLLP